jgi:hypothetical protein
MVVMAIPDRVLEASPGIPLIAVIYPFTIILPAVEFI